jgi:hypothetical protein
MAVLWPCGVDSVGASPACSDHSSADFLPCCKPSTSGPSGRLQAIGHMCGPADCMLLCSLHQPPAWLQGACLDWDTLWGAVFCAEGMLAASMTCHGIGWYLKSEFYVWWAHWRNAGRLQQPCLACPGAVEHRLGAVWAVCVVWRGAWKGVYFVPCVAVKAVHEVKKPSRALYSVQDTRAQAMQCQMRHSCAAVLHARLAGPGCVTRVLQGVQCAGVCRHHLAAAGHAGHMLAKCVMHMSRVCSIRCQRHSAVVSSTFGVVVVVVLSLRGGCVLWYPIPWWSDGVVSSHLLVSVVLCCGPLAAGRLQ